jgi:hypothetical protein
MFPHITCTHKRVEIKMEGRTEPARKFTDLCREVMMLMGKGIDGVEKHLFDAFVLIASGPHQVSASITFRTDNTMVVLMVRKMWQCVAGWFLRYWTLVKCYRVDRVNKFMESFDVDASGVTS